MPIQTYLNPCTVFLAGRIFLKELSEIVKLPCQQYIGLYPVPTEMNTLVFKHHPSTFEKLEICSSPNCF